MAIDGEAPTLRNLVPRTKYLNTRVPSATSLGRSSSGRARRSKNIRTTGRPSRNGQRKRSNRHPLIACSIRNNLSRLWIAHEKLDGRDGRNLPLNVANATSKTWADYCRDIDVSASLWLQDERDTGIVREAGNRRKDRWSVERTPLAAIYVKCRKHSAEDRPGSTQRRPVV